MFKEKDWCAQIMITTANQQIKKMQSYPQKREIVPSKMILSCVEVTETEKRLPLNTAWVVTWDDQGITALKQTNKWGQPKNTENLLNVVMSSGKQSKSS